MNYSIVAQLVGLSRRQIIRIAGRHKRGIVDKRPEVMELLTTTNWEYIQKWLGGNNTRTMCLIAGSHARSAKVRRYALRLYNFSTYIADRDASPHLIKRSFALLRNPHLEDVIDTVIMHTRDNDLKFYITELADIHMRLREGEK